MHYSEYVMKILNTTKNIFPYYGILTYMIYM
jgi:hypothetical protein